MEVIGIREIDRVLAKIPKAFQPEAIQEASKPAAMIIRDQARKNIKVNEKNTDGQSKAAFLSRNTKALKSKSKKNPGYNVYVKGKDIPVGDRFWKISGYAVLFGEGSYKTKSGRKTRGTGADRGDFEGFGNFITKAWEQKGTLARRVFLNNIDRIAKTFIKRA